MSTIAPHPPKTSFDPASGRADSSYTLQLAGGRTVEIGSQPVMIGSGPRCTFRLDAPGTKPVHCVVSVGVDGPVVRRWAEGTLLNGESFTEALLTEGDRLSIGSVHLDFHHQEEPVASQEAEPEELIDELVDELESFEQELVPQELATVEDANDLDPAIPRHLLTPWNAAEPTSEPVGDDSSEETTTAVSEPLSEPERDIEDCLEGESEWSSAGETDSCNQESIEVDVVATEEESAESSYDPPAADPWAVESTFVEDLPGEETPAEESVESSFVSDEPPLSEEVSAWVDNSVQQESASDESNGLESFEEEPTSDGLETDNADLTDDVDDTSSVDAATIVALRARLEIRAERLRGIVKTLRSERVANSRQTGESLAAIEQLQADLANAEQQVGEGAASLEAMQTELAAAGELIETLETSLQEAIEASAVGVQEDVVPPVEESQEPQSPVVEAAEVAEVVDSLDSPVESTVDSESSIWPEPTPDAELTAPESTESEEAPIVSEELWGIEHLAPEASEVESLINEELPVEATHEPPSEELVGSLDDVLLPGETLSAAPEELDTEPSADADFDSSEQAVVPTVDDEFGNNGTFKEEEGVEVEDGNSVLASLMAPLSQDTPEQEVESAEPESFIDRFAHLLPEDSDEVTAEDSIVSPLPASPEVGESLPSTACEQEESEESIDDYMKKMMDRIRGDEAPAPVAPKVSQPVQAKVAPVSAPVAQEPATSEPAQAPLLNLNEMKREPTRALGADLGELRQLANQSARRAIDVSETNDRKEHATMRLVVAGVVTTCGLLACMTAPSLLSWQLYGGLGGLVGGGFLGVRTLKVIQKSASLNAMPINEVEGAATEE